ncbi:MAG: PQQ-binding-like beta-propeller repeat protein [Acidobacteriota bacterium]
MQQPASFFSRRRAAALATPILLAATLVACSPSPQPEGVDEAGPAPGPASPPEETTAMNAQDHSWPTFRGGVARLGTAKLESAAFREAPRRLWRFDAGGTVESSPTLWRDLVLVGSFDGRLFAVERASGELRWQKKTGGLVRASPSVANGAVYFGSDDDFFYALEAASGEELWRYALGPGGQQSSAAIDDGTVYFGAFDRHVYALDAASGELRWRTETGGGILSSPAVADGRVLIGSMDGALHALDAATGERLWRFDGQDGAPVFASPTVAGSAVYIGSFDDHLYALDASSGEEKWRLRTGGDVFSTAAFWNGRLYFGADDGLRAVDAASGEVLWHRPRGGRILASPAVLPESEMLIVGTSTEGVLAYSLAGELLYAIPAADKVWSSVAVADDGSLYFGSHHGFLEAYGPAEAAGE